MLRLPKSTVRTQVHGHRNETPHPFLGGAADRETQMQRLDLLTRGCDLQEEEVTWGWQVKEEVTWGAGEGLSLLL